MADRTSAGLFKIIFDLLAREATEADKDKAREIMRKTRGYDFAAYQMDCDGALLKLGLARQGEGGTEYDDGFGNWE